MSIKIRVALDAMGGDNAPSEIIKGAVTAAENNDIEVVLVGQEAVIQEELDKCGSTDSRISIALASEVINGEESPVSAIQKKKDSSIVVGINLLKYHEVSAFISAGSTGAVVTAALLTLGKRKGIRRPALGAIFPFPTGPLFFLDLGANAECKPTSLVQFANMGNDYMEMFFGITNPRIGLLSNGEENTKGNKLVQKAHKMLNKGKLNFIGNVEGRDITSGIADVIVTDGFTGNVIIKLGESIGEMVLASLKHATTGSRKLKEAVAIFAPVLQAALSPLDYADYGGALLLGVNGNVIIAHGRSHAKAIENAIITAKRAAEKEMTETEEVQEE
ncbi:phosphate acyltransferase PlsX [Chloroflexota bacterium]